MRKDGQQGRKPIPDLSAIRLWVQAGGRCEFCNDYLLIDALTLREANFSNIAHIVAVSPDGPRGGDPMPVAERNSLGNLMLVCPVHHKLIDSKEYAAEYSVAKLRQMKREHEERIRRLTACAPENKTRVLRMRASFDTHPIDPIAASAIEEAITPKYMGDPDGIEIDLTQISFSTTPDYWAACAREIKRRVRSAFEPSISDDAPGSLSVFALAPIPLLALLGNALGPTVPVDLYQRHVDNKSWKWKDGEGSARFGVGKTGDGSGRTALVLLSVSGRIDRELLPESIRGLPAYELATVNGAPARCHINTRADLASFRQAYQRILGCVRDDNPGVTDIHLVAAVPNSAAVACGLDLIRKVHPTVHLYDFDKGKNRYACALAVNEYDPASN